MPSLRRRLPAAVAAVTMLAAGCGGGDSGKTTANTTFITVPVSTTAPPLSQPQLQAVVVQASDLPAGWQAGPVTAPPDQAADSGAFAQCMGATNTVADAVAAAYSQAVSGSSTITSMATSFKSMADVQADTAVLANPKASDCFTQVIKARLTAALPKGTTLKAVTLRVTPGPGTSGPPNVVATASGSVVLVFQGRPATLKDDIAFLAGPQAEAQITFYGSGNGVPAQVRADVIQNVATRLANGS